MSEEEILELFSYRYFNSKTNNYIFSEICDFRILDNISDTCNISTFEDSINIDYAQNIKINLYEVNIKEIFSYVLKLLKIDIVLDFNNKFDLLRFQKIFRTYNIAVQLIFYNVEKLSTEEQMLFNEIYYFNSIFFNINSFIKGDNFQTYFLSNERVLDNRENYTKIRLVKEYGKKYTLK